MEGERIFMKNKKRLAKLIFVAILLLIIWYTFKDSAGDIVAQLQKTPFAGAGGDYGCNRDLSFI